MKLFRQLLTSSVLATSLVAGTAVTTSGVALAAGGGAALEDFTPVRTDRSLQRGARIFVNYCMGCHTADYHRYSHFARDAGLSDQAVVENLIFTTDADGEPSKIGSLMTSNMSVEYGKTAFGAEVPNLALITRSRGASWVYTYMKSFYLDESRPLGANNVVYPNVGMPHVLADLQGWQQLVHETDDEGHEKDVLKPLTAGSLSPDEYDDVVTDLVSFLDYLGDPNREARHSLGIKVMLFLFVFLILAVLLKKEYWKDVPHNS